MGPARGQLGGLANMLVLGLVVLSTRVTAHHRWPLRYWRGFCDLVLRRSGLRIRTGRVGGVSVTRRVYIATEHRA